MPPLSQARDLHITNTQTQRSFLLFNPMKISFFFWNFSDWESKQERDRVAELCPQAGMYGPQALQGVWGREIQSLRSG